jgi:hypothetical protein
MRIVFAATCALAFCCSAAVAQSPAAPPQDGPLQQSVAASAAQAACCAIPSLTEVTITIDKTINSQANHAGETFPITLAVPIIIDGKILIPAGTSGTGEIVHAAKSRFGGRAGELILAVRYFDYGAVRIPLRSLRYIEGHGKDRGDTAAAISVASAAVAPIGGVISMFITGGEVTVPAGTLAKAKTAASVSIPDAAAVSP